MDSGQEVRTGVPPVAIWIVLLIGSISFWASAFPRMQWEVVQRFRDPRCQEMVRQRLQEGEQWPLEKRPEMRETERGLEVRFGPMNFRELMRMQMEWAAPLREQGCVPEEEASSPNIDSVLAGVVLGLTAFMIFFLFLGALPVLDALRGSWPLPWLAVGLLGGGAYGMLAYRSPWSGYFGGELGQAALPVWGIALSVLLAAGWELFAREYWYARSGPEEARTRRRWTSALGYALLSGTGWGALLVHFALGVVLTEIRDRFSVRACILLMAGWEAAAAAFLVLL